MILLAPAEGRFFPSLKTLVMFFNNFVFYSHQACTRAYREMRKLLRE